MTSTIKINTIDTTKTDETIGIDLASDDLISGDDFGDADAEAQEGGPPLPDNVAAMKAAFSGAVFNGAPLSEKIYQAIQIAGDTALDFTISGNENPIQGLSFTDSAGNALKTLGSGAGIDSKLTALDGDKIYLFAAAGTAPGSINEDIVLGYAYDTVTQTYRLVFAIALEESLVTGNVGGTFYTALFEPLAHSNTGSHNEALDLSDTLHIGVTESANFDFTGAPAGNALFMMFQDGTTGIIVTGERPDNLATPDRLNDGDTVNTGKGGGPTTLGSNGQQLKADTGLLFTFVTNPHVDYTVPALSAPESKNEANIQYGSVFGSDGASFLVSQVTPTDSTFTVRITAYATNLVDENGAGTDDDVAQKGNNYVDGILDGTDDGDTTVQVLSVTINGVSLTLDSGYRRVPTSDPNAYVYEIFGVKNGDNVGYTTAGDHNRVLIENAQPTSGPGSNVTFDIGGFSLASSSTIPLPVGDRLQFLDDGPDVTTRLAAPNLRVDDTDIVPITGTSATDSFAGAFAATFGNDGQHATAPLTYALSVIRVNNANPYSGLDDAASGDKIFLRLNTTTKEVEGYLEAATQTLAFKISVDSDGDVTLTQLRAVEHNDPLDPDESTSPASIAAGLVILTATAKDSEGDTDSLGIDIGDNMLFEDDGPAVTLSNQTRSVRVDESDIPTGSSGTARTEDFSAAFTDSYGKDGKWAGDFLTYELSVSNNGDASGLVDSVSGASILLTTNGSTVEGYLASNSTLLAFKVTVDSDGTITLTQYRAVQHDNAGSNTNTAAYDEADTPASVLASRIYLTATAKDGDGDTESERLDIGQSLLFEDDGPSVTTGNLPNPLTVDESDIGSAGGTTSASFLSAFVRNYGKDGPMDEDDDGSPDAGALVFTLDIKGEANDGVASGLTDSASGQGVTLRMNGASVEGYVTINSIEVPVFTISVDAGTAMVTLTQHRSVHHDDPGSPTNLAGYDEANGPALLAAADLVTLTATIRDGDDGHNDSASLTRDIGGSFGFEDDRPTVTDGVAPPTLVTDDTDIIDTASDNFTSAFSVNYGNDGFKDLDENGVDDDALTFVLGLKGGATTGVPTGLTDSRSGAAIYLKLVDGVVRGYATPTGGEVTVFTIAVDTNGLVTLTQSRSIIHAPGSDLTTLAADLVTLKAVALDGDDGASDSAEHIRDIGNSFSFLDDEPDVAVTNLLGSGTDRPQTAFWSDAAALDGLLETSGNDGFGSLTLTLDRYFLNGVQKAGVLLTPTSTPQELLANIHEFSGTIDDVNNDGTLGDKVDFTITLRDDGTYQFDLGAPHSTTVSFPSSQGKLGAGGPDAVQTLDITKDGTTKRVVFFGVHADTDIEDIQSGIQNGIPDKSESALELENPSYLTDADMNVSTAGIGVGNNNLNGYGGTAAGDHADDESFVVNPVGDNFVGLRVYIDNSVGGYSAGESLYYTTYDLNGTPTGPVLVKQTDLVTAGRGLVYFEFKSAVTLDAVQLSMGYGTIKIPVIEFIYEQKAVLPNIDFDFTLNLTDKDGDTDSDSFRVGVKTDNDLTVEPDLIYTGTSEADSFVFDLTVTADATDFEADHWQVDGFNGTNDRLILTGVNSFSMSNVTTSATGDDTITVGSKIITVMNGTAVLEANDFLIVRTDLSSFVLV